jgi:hypothetical protein
MKIEFCEDGSCWIEIKAGRLKWFPKNHDATKAARQGLILDGLHKTQRAFTAGSHEPVVYYRDEEGKINLPPNAEVPQGYERREIRNLREADALCREMSQELRDRFAYDATGDLDDMARDQNGLSPRDLVLRENMNPLSDYGREVTAQMLKELDREEADRKNVAANVFFHWRES